MRRLLTLPERSASSLDHTSPVDNTSKGGSHVEQENLLCVGCSGRGGLVDPVAGIVALAPGKYIFRLGNPETSRNVIQVLSADGKMAYGNFFTRYVERPTPAPNPEVRFMESAPGAPPAIRTIWYPGQRMGRELVYPKDEARRLAKNAKDSVLTTRAQTTTTAQTNTADLSRISSSGAETQVSTKDRPTAAAPTGKTQQGEIAPESLVIIVGFTQ
jgi:hypothetical protein